jgi:hypothetical protein
VALDGVREGPGGLPSSVPVPAPQQGQEQEHVVPEAFSRVLATEGCPTGWPARAEKGGIREPRSWPLGMSLVSPPGPPPPKSLAGEAEEVPAQ